MKVLILFFLFLGTQLTYAKYESVKTYADHVKELKYKTVDGINIAYIDEGEGKPFVLMHGIPTNSWMFRNIIPGLVKKGYRVIAPDLVGMGKSDKIKDEKRLNVESQAKIMLMLLTDELQLTGWTHLVHDFGGPITWTMMADNRFDADELIILDTFLFSEGFSPGLNIFTKGFMQLMTSKPLQSKFFSTAIKSMVQDKKIANEKMIEGYVKPLTDGGAYTYKCLYFSANKLKKNLSQLQGNAERFSHLPTKIIWGKHDKFLDSDIQLNQIKEFFHVGESDVLVLDNAKHIITEESPNEILNFIDN